jgi:hypothetical protein
MLNMQYEKGDNRAEDGLIVPFLASSVQAEAWRGFTKTEIQ